MMDTCSNTIGELTKALAAAQAEMPDAGYDSTNPHFKSRYASLAAVRKATKALAKHGLAVTQVTTLVGDLTQLVLVTRLSHVSGEWIASIYPIPIDKPQQMGSALTYARRYCLAAICGVAADEDDDAEAAQSSNPNERLARRVKPATAGSSGKERMLKHAHSYFGDPQPWDPQDKHDREKLTKLCVQVIGREPSAQEPMTEAEMHRVADDLKKKLAAREARYERVPEDPTLIEEEPSADDRLAALLDELGAPKTKAKRTAAVAELASAVLGREPTGDDPLTEQDYEQLCAELEMRAGR